MYSEQLDYFTLAYHSQSFSVAAGKVPMSVQGFAKAIQKLEGELGVSLFEQDESGARKPTAYADEFMQFVDIYKRSHHHLFERFNLVRAQENKEIRLGASLGILGLLGKPFMDVFYEKHPDISIVYNELPDAVCELGLRDESYDLAFTLAPYSEGMVTTELYSSEVMFWVNKNNPLSSKSHLVIDDFQGETIIIPGQDFKCYQSIIGENTRRKVEPKEIISTQEIFWIYEFVLNNRGIGFTVDHLAALSLFKQSDTVVPLPLRGATWRFGLSHLSQHRLTEEEHFFYRHCVDYCQRFSR